MPSPNTHPHISDVLVLNVQKLLLCHVHVEKVLQNEPVPQHGVLKHTEKHCTH